MWIILYANQIPMPEADPDSFNFMFEIISIKSSSNNINKS